MSIAQEVAPHLPYMRRFARAVSGSQASGDAHVVSTLEALIADPTALPLDHSVRVYLYWLFIRRMRSMPHPFVSASDPELSPGLSDLVFLTPRSRQAFLLHAVEGFSIDEVAVILGAGADEVAALLGTARREIAVQMATDVLIIEDEPLIALDLKLIVKELGHHVTGIARTAIQAISLASEKPPGLVLADIKLADNSSGLDAVNEILQGIALPVIFITAFPELLLTGERPEPAFVLTKPFEPDVVKVTICQALFFDHRASRQAA